MDPMRADESGGCAPVHADGGDRWLMGSSGKRERRCNPRIPIGDLVSFTTFAGAPGLGDGRDVSLGGIRFTAVGCRLNEGDLLQVSFNIGEETVDAVGRVVRSRKLDDITLEIGLDFLRIAPWAARLLEEIDEDDDRA